MPSFTDAQKTVFPNLGTYKGKRVILVERVILVHMPTLQDTYIKKHLARELNMKLVIPARYSKH